MNAVIDSSVLVALLNPGDLWHARALALQGTILKTEVTLIYFDCVVAESISAVARRLHEKGRGVEIVGLLQRLEAQVPRDLITWILPDAPRLYTEAIGLVRSSQGELNFNDALISLACRDRQIDTIVSFDPDFDKVAWLKRVAVADQIQAVAEMRRD
jgi:predicted nucleic acid-binding protein